MSLPQTKDISNMRRVATGKDRADAAQMVGLAAPQGGVRVEYNWGGV